MGDKAVFSGEECSAVAFILSSPANLTMSFPIRLDRIFLGTFFALPFLLAMFSAEMFLDAGEVSQSSGRVMVNTSLLRTDIHFLLDFFVGSLLQLPRKIVTSPVQLQILVSLKTLVAYFAYEPICSHQRLW